MLPVEWRQNARRARLAIVDYISDNNPDAAQRLKDAIEAKVSLVYYNIWAAALEAAASPVMAAGVTDRL